MGGPTYFRDGHSGPTMTENHQPYPREYSARRYFAARSLLERAGEPSLSPHIIS